MKISPAQLRAGRALANLSQADLAATTGLSLPTIKRVESDREVSVSDDAIAALKHAIEEAGVEFTNGGQPGVRARNDDAYGFLFDEGKVVGRIKNGELRSDRDGRLLARVMRGRLHDPETGEFICGLAQLEIKGNPLPPALKAKF